MISDYVESNEFKNTFNNLFVSPLLIVHYLTIDNVCGTHSRFSWDEAEFSWWFLVVQLN